MNAYYEKNASFNSNKRIIEAYLGDAVKPASTWNRLLDLCLSWLAVVLRVLSSATARRIAKAGAVAVTLVGFIGVIGAMERGALGLGMGLLIGAALLGIEILCLRPHRS